MSESLYAYYLPRFASKEELQKFAAAAIAILQTTMLADMSGAVFVGGDANTNTVEVEHILVRVYNSVRNCSLCERN